MKLTTLFSKSEPKAIQALRKIDEQNTADANWRTSFKREAIELKMTRDRLSEQLGKIPTEATARDYIEAHIKHATHEDALVRVTTMVIDPISAKCVARTKSVIKEALVAVRKRLNDERAAVVKSDEANAEKFGVSEIDTSSPIVKRFDFELTRANGFLADLDKLDTMSKLSPVIKFCLQ